VSGAATTVLVNAASSTPDHMQGPCR
jgi:hypothetical protein